MADERDRGLNPGSATRQGWSSLHSWVFIVIVALGFVVTGYFNRYEYLGSGHKAYRVSKITGAIQEYDPYQGWSRAQFQGASSDMAASVQPTQPMTPPPSSVETPSQPQTPVEQDLVAEEDQAPEPEPVADLEQEPENALSQSPEATESTEPESDYREPDMSVEDRYKAFLQLNPGYGEEEFKLANETLFPHWKQNLNPDGNFVQFLSMYKKFTQWWIDAGSPRAPGFQLWKRFLTETNNGLNMPE